jgi:hypothetical protein
MSLSNAAKEMAELNSPYSLGSKKKGEYPLRIGRIRSSRKTSLIVKPKAFTLISRNRYDGLTFTSFHLAIVVYHLLPSAPS